MRSFRDNCQIALSVGYLLFIRKKPELFLVDYCKYPQGADGLEARENWILGRHEVCVGTHALWVRLD